VVDLVTQWSLLCCGGRPRDMCCGGRPGDMVELVVLWW